MEILRAVAFVPDDLQQLPPLDCRPETVGNHRHALPDGEDIPYTRKSLGLGGVEAFDPGAEDRRTCDHGCQHARDMNIDAEYSRTVDLGRAVQAMERLAEQFLRTGLQFRLLGHRQLGSLGSQLAKAEFFPARTVHDTVFGPTGGRVDLPLLCRRS